MAIKNKKFAGFNELFQYIEQLKGLIPTQILVA